jgi:hypothetical protein
MTKPVVRIVRRIVCRENPGQLEQAIKRLLNESQFMLDSEQINSDAANALVKKLLDCAEAASAIQYPYSAHRLKKAASLIKARLNAAKVA